MNAETKTRTITLTSRAPVKIKDAEWPIIAQATGDSYKGNDFAVHDQAAARGELDTYALRVRQHTDGRAIVYGILNGSRAWTGSASIRGGELLDPGADIVESIRRVGEYCNLPTPIISQCISDLPAVEI